MNFVTGREAFKTEATEKDHIYRHFVKQHLNTVDFLYKRDGYVYSDEFWDLYTKLIAYDPQSRPTIDEVLNHPWIVLDSITDEDFYDEMKKRKILKNAKNSKTVRVKYNRNNNHPTRSDEFRCLAPAFDDNIQILNFEHKMQINLNLIFCEGEDYLYLLNSIMNFLILYLLPRLST